MSIPIELTIIPIKGKQFGACEKITSLPPSLNIENLNDVFFVGPENQLVVWAVRWALDGFPTPLSNSVILENPIPGLVPHCPLVFYGPSGCGKTHLALGISQAWRHKNRKKKSTYITADDFARAFASAVASKTVDEFREKVRNAGLLVIDDIDHFKNREAAQNEFLSTVDDFLSNGKTLVLTCSQFPSVSMFADVRLVARLISGLVVPVALPSLITRTALLGRFAKQLEIQLAPSVLQMLARNLPVSIPQLFGILAQQTFETEKKTLDAATVRELVKKRKEDSTPTIDLIAKTTAKQSGIKLSELKGKSRRATTVKVRGIAIYLCRELTDASLKEIGQYFGGRDHTTIAHNTSETASKMASDLELRNAILKIQESLNTATR